MFVSTLKPGETHEMKDELYITQCYDLPPGHYSIRFYYPLRLIADEALRGAYRKAYNDPEYGLIPWDGQDHQFTVVR